MTTAQTWGDMLTALRTAREDRGWGYHRLAKEVGTSSACVFGWERGDKTPSATNLMRWAESLGYSVSLRPGAR